MHTHIDVSFRFEMRQQGVKAVNFDVCYLPPPKKKQKQH